jgi:hypothetical protein
LPNTERQEYRLEHRWGQDKLISTKFNEAKTKNQGYITYRLHTTRRNRATKEIDRDESVLEEKRQEKARLEQARIDNKNEHLCISMEICI